MTTILIAEDEQKTANILASYLLHDGFSAHIISDGAEVIDWVTHHEPDAVLLDLMLPNKDGMQICREIRAQSDIPILMITARVEEIDRLLGLDIGADDYICKPFSPKEVVARLRAVLRRIRPEPRESSAQEPLKIEFDDRDQVVRVNGQGLKLTPVEYRLLKAFSDQPMRAWSRDALLNRMYDDYRIVSDRTVDSHITNLRRKLLDCFEESDLIQSIYGVGYRFFPL